MVRSLDPCSDGPVWNLARIRGQIRQWSSERSAFAASAWGGIFGKAAQNVVVGALAEGTPKNGRRTAQYPGNTQTSATVSGSSPCEVWLVVHLLDGNACTIAKSTTANAWSIARNPILGSNTITVSDALGSPHSITATLSASLTHRFTILRIRINGAASQIWENGVLVATGTLGDAAFSALILSPLVSSVFANCEFGEAGVTDLMSDWSARELSRMLFRKWGDTASAVVGLLADFTTLPVGAAATLSSGMILTSGAANARTVQTSESTVVCDVTQNHGRIGRLAAAHLPALVLESARTNRWPGPRSVPAVGGVIGAGLGETTTLSGLPGPDGAGNAPRYQILSTGYSRYLTENGQPSLPCVYSQWYRAPAGVTSQQFSTYNGTVLASGGDTDTTWKRIVIPRTAFTVRAMNTADGRDLSANGGIVAGARDVVCDLVTVTDGAVPTEAIQTGLATRDGETLRLPGVIGDYTINGRLNLHIRFRPKATPVNYPGTVYFWYLDTSNRAYLTPATGTVSVRITGVTVGSPAGIVWAAGDTVDLHFACGGGSLPTVVQYQVNGGAVTTWTLATQGAIGGSALYVMSNDTGTCLDSRIERIQIS